MKKKVTAEMLKLVQSQLASRGGKARAEKYSKAKLSEWAKLGGRPRKRSLVAKGTTDGLVTSGKCSKCGMRFIPTHPSVSPRQVHRDLMTAFKKHECREVKK